MNTNKEREHPLLTEMAKLGPLCNWIRHDGNYTKEDKIAQDKFLRLMEQYYNDPAIPESPEKKAQKILVKTKKEIK